MSFVTSLLIVLLGPSALFLVALAFNRPARSIPATVADDPTLPSVTIDGVTFHAETRGDPANPTVIVLHGGPGGSGMSGRVLVREGTSSGDEKVFLPLVYPPD